MEYENICTACSKTFLTSDIDMNYCPECWEKAVGLSSLEDCETLDTTDEQKED